MSAAPSAEIALAALWQVLVEIAEATNDAIVLQQRTPSDGASAAIARACADAATLTQAAAVLTRLAERP